MGSATLCFSKETYISRRKNLMKSMGSGKILLLGNDESSKNFRDNHYPYRQDSTFLYYIGIDLPGLIAIIDVDKGRTTLYGNELTIDDIVWTGKVPSLHELAELSGITKVKSRLSVINQIDAEIHYLPPYRDAHTVLLSQLTGKKNRKAAKRYSVKLIKAISKQREIKSDEEIAQMNEAASISHNMHLNVMEGAQVGIKEHDLVAIAAQTAWNHHVALSFPPIMTINGQVLHNHYYGNELKEGHMVLFDGGCESLGRYAGDITRTFPVGRSFTDRQKQMYDIVHAAYTKAIEVSESGTKFLDVHITASKVIVEGLIGLGIMKGDVNDAIDDGAHTMFFQCGLGHLIGLDVHDMENFGEEYIGYTKSLKKRTDFGFKSLRLGKELKEGFCITIEPGIYIIPDLIDLRLGERKHKDFINYDELNKWRDFGGIRLEDDFYINGSGAQKLGIDIPTTSNEIEEVRAQSYQ